MSLRKKIECPVDEVTREWLDRRWQWLCRQFGEDRLRQVEVILPSPEFFPEPYAGTEEDAEVVLYRVAHYMSLVPATVALRVYAEDRATLGLADEMHQGTEGLYYVEDGIYQICVETKNLDNPANLVATLAHELGHVHLLGHGRVTRDDDDHEPLTDLLTVFFGLGVFSANAVFHEHYWDVGQLHGWSMGRRGYLAMTMFGYAFALFAKARGEDSPPWADALRLDVRTAFRQSQRLLAEEHGLEVVYAPQLSLAKPKDTQPAEGEKAEEAGGPRCTYCNAVVETDAAEDDEPPVCQACQKSVDESYQEDEAPSWAERSRNFDRYVLYGIVLLILIAFLSWLVTG